MIKFIVNDDDRVDKKMWKMYQYVTDRRGEDLSYESSIVVNRVWI